MPSLVVGTSIASVQLNLGSGPKIASHSYAWSSAVLLASIIFAYFVQDSSISMVASKPKINDITTLFFIILSFFGTKTINFLLHLPLSSKRLNLIEVS